MTDGLPDPLPTGIINGAIGSLAIAQNVSTEFLGPSSKRVGLIISIGPGSNAAINNRPIAAGSDGLQWVSGQTPIYLDDEQYSNLVKKPWFILAPAAAVTASWVELIRD